MALSKKIQTTFPYLFNELCFEILDEPDSEMVVIAKSGDLRLRFVQDRSDFFLDVGKSSTPNQWTGFYEILDDLRRNGRICLNYKYANKMRAVSNTLKANYPMVKEYVLAKH